MLQSCGDMRIYLARRKSKEGLLVPEMHLSDSLSDVGYRRRIVTGEWIALQHVAIQSSVSKILRTDLYVGRTDPKRHWQ